MRKVLVFESKKCIGCRSCEQICTMTHIGVTNPEKARIRIIRDHELQMDIGVYCHQCGDAPCVQACKFDALARDPKTHAIQVKEENCVACRACIEECPFAAPSMHPSGEHVLICDLCGGEPQCVEICPEHAIQYVGIDKTDNIHKSQYVKKMSQTFKEANKS